MSDSALSRALARIDELEADLSAIHLAARAVVDAFEPRIQEVVGRDMRRAVTDLDVLTAELSMPVARTEHAQGSTTTLVACRPCECGHSAWEHWLLQGECDNRTQCKCEKFVRST